MAVTAFIGLGANLGNARQALENAIRSLGESPGILDLRASSLYSSAPVDAVGDDYVNAVVQVETTLTAPALLQLLQHLESAAGRQRPFPNAPRTLDLDLLLYGDASIVSPDLEVPHPRMRSRAFVLLPLQELAPERVDPSDLYKTLEQRVIRL